MISMRSRSGGGIGSKQVGRRDEQHLSIDRRAHPGSDPEGVVLPWVEHFEQRRTGIAAKVGRVLSTSSIMKTGLFVSARWRPCMIWPGSAPIYVRRWPRISASSCTPPRRNPDEFPAQGRGDRLGPATSCLPREVRRTEDGRPFFVFFSFRTARCSTIRSLIFSRP